MSKPLILLVCTNADTAGAPLHVWTIVQALHTQFNFHCVFGEQGEITRRIQTLNVPVTIIPFRSAIQPLRDWQAMQALNRLCQQIRPSLIHAHSAKAGMLARLVARWRQLPCLYTVHGWGFGLGRPRVQSLILQNVEWVLARLTKAHFIYVSHADAKQAQTALKVRATQGQVIHNGVADHGMRANVLAHNTPLMVARVAYQKNHQTLVQAFAQSSYTQLTLMGEGTNSPAFQAQLKQWAATKYKQIQALGVQTNVPAHFSQAGCLVLSTHYEGLPLAIIEAMCAGLPILATDVGGVNELVQEDVNGYLLPVKDPAYLQAKLEQLQDPTLRQRLGQASRQLYTQHFSLEQMLHQLSALYHQHLHTISA
jgi:glycosyltransferase involved in cell wall biosynthesis